jgi:mRNA interferase RelE/StbE
MYAVIWTEKSAGALASLPKDVAVRILARLEQIRYTPYHFSEHLTDIEAWKIRIGDYRVIIDIDESKKEITVHKVGHRKNVYK